MKNLAISALIGLAIGQAMEIIASIIYSIYTLEPEYLWASPQYLAMFGGNTLLAAIIAKGSYLLLGLGFHLLGKVYEAENLSLALRTLIHFLLTFAMLTGVALGLKWVSISLGGFIFFTLIFVGIYLINWILSYLSTQRSVREVNSKLQASA